MLQHMLPDNESGCVPFSEDFRDHISTIKRSTLEHQENSSLVRSFVLIEHDDDCYLGVKLFNIEEAGIDLAIVTYRMPE